MSVPSLIPIAWLPGLETEFVGLTQGERQFMGFCLSLPPVEKHVPDSPRTRRWAAFVHLFGLDGLYMGTLYKNHGSLESNEQARDLAQAELTLMLTELGPVQYGDIAVQPFQTRVGGVEAGLLMRTTTEAEEGDANEAGATFVLEPNGLIFGPPFSGDYVVKERR